jgi:preprotein translocase subunit SecD
MLDFPRWKYALVLFVLLFAVFYALPNIYPQDAAIQVSANRGNTVDAELAERVRGVLEANDLQAKGIAEQPAAQGSGKTLLVRMSGPEQQLTASDLIRRELGDGFTVALNLAPTTPDWLRAIGAKAMTLGLDLQGGVHFLMEIDQAAALEKRESGFADDIRLLLRDANIVYTRVDRTANGIVVALRNAEEREAARAAIARQVTEMIVDEGSEPNQLIGRLRPEVLNQILADALEQNVGTLRNRINELGVAEPIITRQGNSRIVVQLPGVQDTAQAKRILGSTATLEYRAQVDGNALEAVQSGRIPPEAKVYYMRETGPGGERIPVLLNKRVIASGDQLVHASSMIDPDSGTPAVSVRLNAAGGQRMLEFTRDNVGRGMGVVFIERRLETRVVDGKEVRNVRVTEEVISLANIQGVFSNQFQTTGLGSTEEAAQLALMLRAGSLAAPVDIVEERVVGPSLGAENIKAGANAVMLGFAMVCALMIVYYKLAGVIGVVALFINLLLLTAVLSVVGATLTMPGIAGIVLTLGMAIDGNVLIIERIREEVRNGNTPVNSILSGYERAWSVILDSNITKLIAAIALFSFGSGPVRGFAAVLFFGVLTSMFTSVTVSRAFTTLIYGHGRKVRSVSV